MNPRSMLQDALQHRTPERLPVDLGASAVTGIHCSVVAELRARLGLEDRLVKVHEPFQMSPFVLAGRVGRGRVAACRSRERLP